MPLRHADTRVSRLLRLLGASGRSVTVHVVVLTGLHALFAMTFAVLSARWLGPASRGFVVIMTTLGSLLMLIGSLGVATGGRLLLSGNDPALPPSRWHRVCATVGSGQVPLVFGLGLPLLMVTGGWSSTQQAVTFGVYGIAVVVGYLYREGLHGVGAHRAAVGSDVLMNAVLVIGVIGLRWTGALSVESVTFLLAGSATLQAAGLALFFAGITKDRSWPEGIYVGMRKLVAMSAPALLASLGQAYVTRGDRLLLGVLTDERTVGLYGTAATFTEVAWLAPLALSQVVFRASAQHDTDKVRRLRRRSAVVSVATAVVAAPLAAPLVRLLMGSAYEETIPMIWVLLPATVGISLFLPAAAALNGLGDLSGPAIASGLGSVVLTIAALVTIPLWGAYGAALASTLAYGLMAFVAERRLRRGTRREAIAVS